MNFLEISKTAEENFVNITSKNAQYHFLQNLIGRNENNENFLFRTERRLIKLQRKMGINRFEKCPLKIYKGSQWFSITHQLVQEVLQKENLVRKFLYKSYCPDEIFLNTIAMNSNLPIEQDNNLRLIDWKRGHPYTFCLADYDELMKSEALFARKFTCSTADGKQLIAKINNNIASKI